MDTKIGKISNQASLVIQLENNSLKVNSTFRLNRFNTGMLLILACSLFFIAIASYKATGITLAFALVLGILLTIASAASIVKQFTDFLMVTDTEIVFRNSLQKKTFSLTPKLKVKTSMKRKFALRPTSVQGSYSWEVDMFIKKKKDKIKYRILDFSMEDKNYEDARYLSKVIAQFIKSKIENTASHSGTLDI